MCCRSSLVYFSEAAFFLLKRRSCKAIKPSHAGKKEEMW